MIRGTNTVLILIYTLTSFNLKKKFMEEMALKIEASKDNTIVFDTYALVQVHMTPNHITLIPLIWACASCTMSCIVIPHITRVHEIFTCVRRAISTKLTRERTLTWQRKSFCVSGQPNSLGVVQVTIWTRARLETRVFPWHKDKETAGYEFPMLCIYIIIESISLLSSIARQRTWFEFTYTMASVHDYKKR